VIKPAKVGRIMNTKNFLRLGVPLSEARRRATDFVSSYILSGGDKSRLEKEVRAIGPDLARKKR